MKNKKTVDIQLNPQTLTPLDQKINLFSQLKIQPITDKTLSNFYRQGLNNKFPFHNIIVQPLQLKQPETIQEHQNNQGAFVQVFNLLNMQTLQEFIGSQHLTSLQLNNIARKLIQITLCLAECQLFIKIRKNNVYIAQGLEEDKRIRILAIETMNQGKKQEFCMRLAKILKFMAIDMNFQNYNQLVELYGRQIKQLSVQGEDSKGYFQQIMNNKLFLSDVLQIQQNFRKSSFGIKSLLSQDQCSLSQEQIEWLTKEHELKHSGCELTYKSSQDGFTGKQLWEHLLASKPKHRQQQLIVLFIHSNGIHTKLGFLSSCFTNPENKELLEKHKKFGCYLPDNKLSSLLINFPKKTIHLLKQQKFCIGYCPEKYLLCLGKCDIVISSKNITNLCYYPVSYAVDIDQLVVDTEAMCGNRQFELKDLYVYRFKK